MRRRGEPVFRPPSLARLPGTRRFPRAVRVAVRVLRRRGVPRRRRERFTQNGGTAGPRRTDRFGGDARPEQPADRPKDVPGVLHLPLKVTQPFRLLHAKVVLSGFRHTTNAKDWQLRLIVSTGNWTRATLEDSLDLAWRIDISREDHDEADEALPQACADLRAAWNLLGWVQQHFDDRALKVAMGDRVSPEPESVTVEKWIAKATKPGRDIAPRFFDNRKDALLTQLPGQIRTHCAGTARQLPRHGIRLLRNRRRG